MRFRVIGTMLVGAAAVASGKAEEAGQSAAAAEDWSELSRQWAENPEDTVVGDGGYSSFHWAKKSQQAAAETVTAAQEALQGYVDSAEGFAQAAEAAAETAETIKEEIKSLQGVVTYLDGHDFGDPADDPDWQQTLTDYALAQVPDWETVPNSCDVVNLWDGHEWIYNIETQSCINFGSATVTEATATSAGIVKADVEATPGTAVLRDADGRAEISAPVAAAQIANKGYVDEGDALAFGVGQTWQDVLSSRTYNVWYTNTTTKLIIVCINRTAGAESAAEGVVSLHLKSQDDVSFPNMEQTYYSPTFVSIGGTSLVNSMYGFVPPGWSYQWSRNSGNTTSFPIRWYEFRE